MYAGKGVRPATWQSGPEFLVSDAALRAELNTEVMWACAQIINNGNEKAKLQANYEDIFKKICADETNYYNSEVFWDVFTSVYGKDSRKHESVFEEFYRNEFNKVKSVCGPSPKADGIVKMLKN